MVVFTKCVPKCTSSTWPGRSGSKKRSNRSTRDFWRSITWQLHWATHGARYVIILSIKSSTGCLKIEFCETIIHFEYPVDHETFRRFFILLFDFHETRKHIWAVLGPTGLTNWLFNPETWIFFFKGGPEPCPILGLETDAIVARHIGRQRPDVAHRVPFPVGRRSGRVAQLAAVRLARRQHHQPTRSQRPGHPTGSRRSTGPYSIFGGYLNFLFTKKCFHVWKKFEMEKKILKK